MLHFCNTNIYLLSELSPDLADDIWVTDVPHCVNEGDIKGIFEPANIHLFNFLDISNPTFLRDKRAIALRKKEFIYFIMEWYESCVKRKVLSRGVVDFSDWTVQYFDFIRSKTNSEIESFEGALGYYESVGRHNYLQTDKGDINYSLDLTKYNAPPELSWMLADYIKNGNKSWVNVLNAHIQQTDREVRFAIADLPTPKVLGVDAGRFAIDNYPIELNQTVEDINWEDEGSINYIVNPFDKDVHTNVRALYELLW